MVHCLSAFIETAAAFACLMTMGMLGAELDVGSAPSLSMPIACGWSVGGMVFGDERLFEHERGHVLQRQRYGLAYYLFVAVPSVLSYWTESLADHADRWYERQATEWGVP